MSSSATASAGSSSSAIPHPASASTSAGLGSGGASQEIQAVPPTPFENLCLSRPGGLPIIEGLSPTDAVVFYYGEYQPESDNRRTSRSRSVGDYQLRYVGGAEKWKEEAEKEEAGTDAKDKQPAAPSIASEPPRATYDIVSLAEIDSATGARRGNIPWLKDNRPAHVQIPYIQTFTLENIKKLFDSSPPILYSRELFQTDGKDPFINAVRVRAEESSHNIFVGLPYLGCGLETNDDSIPQDGIENGMKLPYYGGCEGVEEGPDYGMRVWQSWQILFDDTRLALIKSPDSPGSKCAPLFGHQTTFGPLHALALIIGNLFRHEVQPLEVLRAKVDEDISNIEAKMSEHVLLEPDQLTGVVRRDYRGMIRVSDGLLERHILNLKTIIVILRKQLSILRDLETITTNQQDPRYRPAFGNPVPLPKFDGQSEQLKNARAVFEQLIVERGRVLTDMNTLLDDVKKRRSELRGELRMVREQLQEEGRHNLTVDLSAALERQGETTVKMKNIMARQGQTVSFFAFITAVFLPLEFFAQVSILTTLLSPLHMLIKRWSST
ncbi:hypothetical protein P167DRAFT_50571 [Morchella conica CCBAS932]|uniref:Uncharacterized protein n=1 Tax=Morchella conica CCBAS932 TaxID=1392247 RepID=A0A3N4KB74_9PEZI|nr:hypothetical protein P167DRAFT_50571 [Morchella conica CCBAS932]